MSEGHTTCTLVPKVVLKLYQGLLLKTGRQKVEKGKVCGARVLQSKTGKTGARIPHLERSKSRARVPLPKRCKTEAGAQKPGLVQWT